MASVIDETHDLNRTSWLSCANGHRDFPIQNLPFGVFRPRCGSPRGGVAIGDYIVDLKAAADAGLFHGAAAIAAHAASERTLDSLLAIGPTARRALRRRLSQLLQSASPERHQMERTLHAAGDCELQMPLSNADYAGFFTEMHRAMNIGRQIRRAEFDISRLADQRKLSRAGCEHPMQSADLTFDSRFGAWIGGKYALGLPILITETGDRIAGLCVLDERSGCEIRAWESQPLGSFLSNNVMITVSPWVITSDALAPFRIPEVYRPRSNRISARLQSESDEHSAAVFAIELEVYISTQRMRDAGHGPHLLSRFNVESGDASRVPQSANHHASACPNLSISAFDTSGASVPDSGKLGGLIVFGSDDYPPVTLVGGETRSFLQNGDELLLQAHTYADDRVSIGFGECRGTIRGLVSP